MSRWRTYLSTWYLPRQGRAWLLVTAVLLAVGVARSINLLTLVMLSPELNLA